MSDEIRIYRRAEDPFARVPKPLLNDSTLSWKAKGIASYLFGKPVDWRIRVADLIKRSTDGRDAVYAGMKELRTSGYMARREKVRSENGQVGGCEYLLADTPIFKDDLPLPENPEAVGPDTAFPDTANPDPENPDRSKKEGDRKENVIKKTPPNWGDAPEDFVPGYDSDPEEDRRMEELLAYASEEELRSTLLPLFGRDKVRTHLSHLEESLLRELEGKVRRSSLPSLVRFYKLPADTNIPEAKTRKRSLRTLLENMGEQEAVALKVFPPEKKSPPPPAARLEDPTPAPAKTEDELDAEHAERFRQKIRDGLGRKLVPPISAARADDPDLPIPPRK